MQSKFLSSCIATALVAAFAFGPAAMAGEADGKTDAVYVAHLSALNSDVAGSTAAGEVRFEVRGDVVVISADVEGVTPGIIHWQHTHGFKEGGAASCATATADANGDGIVDLMETGTASGTTMIPFDHAPAGMDVAHGMYPQASIDGTYTYEQTVPLADLSEAFGSAFPGQALDFDDRVVYVHGVSPATALPDTVASLGPIPASVTLPIACGEIERVDAAK